MVFANNYLALIEKETLKLACPSSITWKTWINWINLNAVITDGPLWFVDEGAYGTNECPNWSTLSTGWGRYGVELKELLHYRQPLPDLQVMTNCYLSTAIQAAANSQKKKKKESFVKMKAGTNRSHYGVETTN